MLCKLYDPWKGDVAKSKRAGTAYGSRHIGHAVVEDFIDDVSRIAVRGRFAGLDASALIDRDIDNNTPRFHELEIFTANQIRSFGTRDQNRADDQICKFELFSDVVAIGVDDIDVRWHDVIEVAHTVQVDIEDVDVGAETSGDASCVGTDDSTSQDRNVRRWHSWDPT